MKTFEEALKTVFEKELKGATNPEYAKQVRDDATEEFSHKELQTFIMDAAMVVMLKQVAEGPEKSFSSLCAVLHTMFSVGRYVGQEMEKGEFVNYLNEKAVN